MSRKLRSVVLVTLVLLFFNNISSANLVFQMTASNTTLGFGDSETIGLWAWAQEATGMNGLNLWQLDMVVDVPGVVKVTNVEILQPTPLDPYIPSGTVDSLGNVFGLGGGVLSAPQDSSVGVGGFTLMANITIEAIGAGVVEYDLAGDTQGFYGHLRDFDWMSWIDPGGTVYDFTYDAPYKAVFEGGDNIFAVVPEPASLVIMAVMAGLALRNRKIGAGK